MIWTPTGPHNGQVRGSGTAPAQGSRRSRSPTERTRGRADDEAGTGSLPAGAVVPDPPAVLPGMCAQLGVGFDRHRVTDPAQPRPVVGRLAVRRPAPPVAFLPRDPPPAF